MSTRKRQKRQTQAADAAINYHDEVKAGKTRDEKWYVQTVSCEAAEGNNTERRTAAHNHVVRLHESSQPVKAKTVKEKTMEFHAGPRPSR